VLAAVGAVERIAAGPAWPVEHGARPDLRLELTQIDEQAHRLALARPAGAAPTGTAWDALLTRVAALTAYADELEAVAARRHAERRATGDPARDAALLSGAARDELASGQLQALTAFLTEPPRYELPPNYEA
jgi:hypothetical protein